MLRKILIRATCTPQTILCLMSSSSMLSFCANSARRASSIHSSITQTVGETPIVKLQRMAPAGVDVFVKCEAANPGGSVKDRLALGIIEYAEKEGHLKPGQTVVEATSGNTGIGLAMVCAARGYPLVVVMAESFSIERRKLMRFLGAKVILTNPGKLFRSCTLSPDRCLRRDIFCSHILHVSSTQLAKL